MVIPYFIEEILKKQTIVEYLSSKGIEPIRQDAKRIVYGCPSPNHDDSTPSFCVYDWNGYQHFKCYGCGIKGNLVHLHAEMEGIPLKSAVGSLGGDIKIDSQTDLNQAIKNLEVHQDEDDNDLENLSLLISRLCFSFLQHVDFDAKEIEFIDQVLLRVDDIIKEMDIEALKRVYENMTLGIGKRIEKFDDSKERNLDLK